jgi:hypothetical protein
MLRSLFTNRFHKLARLGQWLAAACLLATAGSAQTLYWDTNGKTAGAGGTVPAGIWTTSNSDKNWNTTAAGTTTNPQAWTSGANAVFSAGSDATGAYTVTVNLTQNVSSITVEEGSPTLGSGTINFSDASPDILVAAGRSLTFATALTSANNGLNIGSSTFTGTTVFATDLTLGGTVNLGGGTLSLAGANYSLGTLNVTGNSTIDFAGATTLSVSTLTISAGVTLTIQNWTQASDFFYATTWTGAVPDLADNLGAAPMSQVVFTGFAANQSGWDSFDDQIRPNVPEPSTYGAILFGLLTGFFAWRRLVRRSTR